MIRISASLLAANYLVLLDEIASVLPLVDSFHLDVMDGHFVPNLGLGCDLIKSLPAGMTKEVHLMVTNPEEVIEDLKDVAVTRYYVHPSTIGDWPAFVQMCRLRGSSIGVVLNPDQNVQVLDAYMVSSDAILVMGVQPGFSGQQFLPQTTERVAHLRQAYPELEIVVDGGINADSAAKVIAAGANGLVLSSYLFGSSDRVQAIKTIRAQS